MNSSQRERMIPMLKKLTILSLSLLLCLSLLPSQAGAMDISEDEPFIQAGDVASQVSPGDADAGIAPCYAVPFHPGDEGGGGFGGGIGAGDYYGSGATWGGGMTP